MKNSDQLSKLPRYLIILFALFSAVAFKIPFPDFIPPEKGEVKVKLFATWCGYCRLELVHQLNEGKLSVDEPLNLLVPEDNLEAAKRFVDYLKIPANIYRLRKSQIKQWNIRYFPTTIYFEDGKVKRMVEGNAEESLPVLPEKGKE